MSSQLTEDAKEINRIMKETVFKQPKIYALSVIIWHMLNWMRRHGGEEQTMIQIDIPMPRSCYTCPMSNDGFYLCNAMGKMLEDDCCDRRPEWCPLKGANDEVR